MERYTTEEFYLRVKLILEELSIPETYCKNRSLPLYMEATKLYESGVSWDNKPQFLEKETLLAWKNLKILAKIDNINLLLDSTFRSISHQKELIYKELRKGVKINRILEKYAAPGFSEHHTGFSIDITTSECLPDTDKFENTMAFKWLKENAHKVGLTMSFPQNNRHGIIYEPWHWALSSEIKGLSCAHFLK